MSTEWLTPETIIAISTVIIALCALAATIWQGCLTRKHNRLTVKPISSFYVSVSSHAKNIGISIKNKGYGPLIVTKATISKNGKSYELHDAEFITLFNKLQSKSFHFNVLGKGFVILPSDSVWLISTSEHKNKDELREIMIEELALVKIEIEFESIYGDKSSDITFVSFIPKPC